MSGLKPAVVDGERKMSGAEQGASSLLTQEKSPNELAGVKRKYEEPEVATDNSFSGQQVCFVFSLRIPFLIVCVIKIYTCCICIV